MAESSGGKPHKVEDVSILADEPAIGLYLVRLVLGNKAAEPIRDIVRKPCAAKTGVRFCRTARYALFIWMFVYEFLYSDGVMCV